MHGIDVSLKTFVWDMWGFAYLSLAPHETLPLRTNSRSFNQLEVLPARCIRSKPVKISCFLTFICALQIPNCCGQEFAPLGPTRVKLWIPHDSTKGNNQIVKAKVQSASSWPSSIMTSAQTGSPLEVQFCTSLLFDLISFIFFHDLMSRSLLIFLDLFGSCPLLSEPEILKTSQTVGMSRVPRRSWIQTHTDHTDSPSMVFSCGNLQGNLACCIRI